MPPTPPHAPATRGAGCVLREGEGGRIAGAHARHFDHELPQACSRAHTVPAPPPPHASSPERGGGRRGAGKGSLADAGSGLGGKKWDCWPPTFRHGHRGESPNERGAGTAEECGTRARLCFTRAASQIPVAVGWVLLIVCLFVLAGRGDGALLSPSELQDIKAMYCRNGTLSMTKVCNTTYRSYPTGCHSDTEQQSCSAPKRGAKCSVIGSHNLTCITPIRCSSSKLEVPANSRLAVDNPSALETVAVVCNSGYEYVDRYGEGMGFSASVECLEQGNFSSIHPADFSCVPVQCGLFCRTCSDLTSVVSLPDGDDFSDWGHRDRFGQCCLARSDPDQDTFNSARLTGYRLAALNIALVSSITTVSFPDSIPLRCEPKTVGSQSVATKPVPGSGVSNPRCIAREGCVFNAGSGTWSPPACQWVRGMYEPAMTCQPVAAPATVIKYEMLVGSPGTWDDVDADRCFPGFTPSGNSDECEFSNAVRVILGTTDADPNAQIIWSFASGSPVTEATGLVESSPANGGAEYNNGITIQAVIEGCNVFNQYQKISAMVLVPGKPNSILMETPLLKVTSTNGKMPSDLGDCMDDADGAQRPWCCDVDGRPRDESQVYFWCQTDRLSTKAQCGGENWVPMPPMELNPECAAYRYLIFEPVSLASSDADAYALSELKFFYRNLQMVPVSVSAFGKHPAAEASIYVVDGSLDTKILQMDTCSLEFDFGSEIALDEYQIGTANDCNARDPLRWKMYMSNDRIKWVMIEDQSTNSYPMPTARLTQTPRIAISSLSAAGLNAHFFDVHLSESTQVPDALNTITISFSIKSIVNCPPLTPSGTVCYKVNENNGKHIVRSAPVGTVVHIGGFEDVRTPETSQFAVHSILACASTRLECSPSVLYRTSIWSRTQAIVGEKMKSRLQITLVRCLNTPTLRVSFHTMNPTSRVYSQLVFSMRAEQGAEIDEMELVDGSCPRCSADSVDVLKAGAAPLMLDAFVSESTRQVGRNNTIQVNLVLNFAAMIGTHIRLEGLNGSMTPSTPNLPIHFIFEDGSSVPTTGEWVRNEPGVLSVTQTVDARYVTYNDGTYSKGHNVTLRFALVNRDVVQAPQQVKVMARVCSRPASVGSCPGGPFKDLPPMIASGSVLSSAEPCVGVQDECKQCDGQNTICLGCDAIPNSGKAVDVCGVCGGVSRCVGCDGVKDSGLFIDSCGVCAGDNDCEINTAIGNITWPHILATLSIAASPNTATIKAYNSLRFNLRSALADTFLLPPISVDLLGYNDARRRHLSERALLFFTGTPSSLAKHTNPSSVSGSWVSESMSAIASTVGDKVRVGVKHLQTAGKRQASPAASRRARGWEVRVVASGSAALRSLGDAAAFALHRLGWDGVEEEGPAGVCDARKACWSGCMVNSPPLGDDAPLTQQEVDACVLPPEMLLFVAPSPHAPAKQVYKGPKRRQTRAPVQLPEMEYADILLDIRLNYRLPGQVTYLQDHFAKSVENGTLSEALGRFGFCRSDTRCDVSLVDVAFRVVGGEEEVVTKKTDDGSELRIILISLGAVFGLLLCLALALAWRWRKAIWLRKNMAVYKMSDLMEATERGKKENLRRAHPSSFKPPEGFETNTVGSASRRGESFKGTSTAGSFKQKVFDDTGSVVSGRLGSVNRQQQDDARSTRSSVTGSIKSKGVMTLNKMDRQAIYQHAFPEKFEEVPEATIFEDDNYSRASGEENVAESLSSSRALGSRAGSIKSSHASTRSSVSDRFGDRLTPGPRGRGPAPVHGSGQARQLFNHPVAVRAEAEAHLGYDEEDGSSGAASEQGSERGSERGSLLGRMGRKANGVANGVARSMRAAETEDDVEHSVAV